MLPEVGWRNLVSKLKKVVLPAPLGPISAWISRRRTRTETPSTATNPLNSLTRLCVSRITSSVAIAPKPLNQSWSGCAGTVYDPLQLGLSSGRSAPTVNCFESGGQSHASRESVDNFAVVRKRGRWKRRDLALIVPLPQKYGFAKIRFSLERDDLGVRHRAALQF